MHVATYMHSSRHYFVPVAIKTSGIFGPEAISFIKELGRRIRAETGEPCSMQFNDAGYRGGGPDGQRGCCEGYLSLIRQCFHLTTHNHL